jgi:hypothetical protein
MCVGHHFTQTNTNNVNKTWTLLQTTRGYDGTEEYLWLQYVYFQFRVGRYIYMSNILKVHIMLYRVHLAWAGFELATLVVMGTDCICSWKSNNNTITTMTAPHSDHEKFVDTKKVIRSRKSKKSKWRKKIEKKDK